MCMESTCTLGYGEEDAHAGTYTYVCTYTSTDVQELSRVCRKRYGEEVIYAVTWGSCTVVSWKDESTEGASSYDRSVGSPYQDAFTTPDKRPSSAQARTL